MARTISDEEILNAALDVIIEHGYTAATTRRISAAAGINEVTLFRRFGSKKNLLITAIEQEVETFIAAGIEYTGDLEADLLRIVQFYHNLLKNRGRAVSMLLTEIPRQSELQEVMQIPLKVIEKIKAVLKRYQDEGVLVKEPPMQAFVSLVGPLFMKEIVKFIQPNYSDASFEIAEHVRRYLQGRIA